MKTKLLMLVFFIAYSLQAQTTHDLDWERGFESPESDLTIDVGDTVRWTWTDDVPHTVENNTGSTETFSSEILTGVGQTYSYTFTTEGVNPYFCGIHGAGNMSGVITVQSQATTYDLDWEIGSQSPQADLTIEVGDTVRWTWTDALPHTVENNTGSTETFNSGTLTGNGQMYSYTFTTEGVNPYFCGIHGAGNMSGVITVQETLSTDKFNVASINIYPNPVSSNLMVKLPQDFTNGNLVITDITGKTVLSKTVTNNRNDLQIDVSNIKSGMYLIRLEFNNQNITKRLIIK